MASWDRMSAERGMRRSLGVCGRRYANQQRHNQQGEIKCNAVVEGKCYVDWVSDYRD